MKTYNKTTVPAQPFHEGPHFCQIHQNGSSLTAAAIRYLQPAAVNGESLVMITDAERRTMILDWLVAAGVDVRVLQEQQRLFVRTNEEVIEALFDNGMPEWEVFEAAVTEVLDAASCHGEKKIRFYGDAVSDLWAAGNHAGTIALEECWDRLKRQNRYRAEYFCGYVIDALSPQSYSSHLPDLGRTHCMAASPKEDVALIGALDRAGREILGVTLSHAAMEDCADKQRRRLPEVFETGLWLERNHPGAMARVLGRAKVIYGARGGRSGAA